MVGGRWYGTAFGRNFLVSHRKNLFKVAPVHLRHVTAEEMHAQIDGRELGIGALVNTDQKKFLGNQFVDLTQQSGPEVRSTEHVVSHPGLLEDHWIQRGGLLSYPQICSYNCFHA